MTILNVMFLFWLSVVFPSISFAEEVSGSEASVPGSGDSATGTSTTGEYPFPAEVYKPFYIIVGISDRNGDERNSDQNNKERCDIKFQVSLKKNLWPERADTRWSRYLRPAYFGYTQKSFWNICRGSAPFRETNYNPSFFVELPADSSPRKQLDEWFIKKGGDRIRVSYGYEHESNGQAAPLSRGWDRLYVEAKGDWGGTTTASGFDEQGHSDHELVVKGWTIVHRSGYNALIGKHMGYGELSYSRIGKPTGFLKDIIGNTRTTLTARLRSVRLDFVMSPPSSRGRYWGLLQYFSGYGDELERYNQHESAIRIGVAFSTR
jgi:phospholipase A1